MTLRDELAAEGKKEFEEWASKTSLQTCAEGGYSAKSLLWAYEAGRVESLEVFKKWLETEDNVKAAAHGICLANSRYDVPRERMGCAKAALTAITEKMGEK